jgi:hypothetical protein
MLPPRLIRRLVLAPLAIVIAVALAVLFPLLALLALLFGAVGRSRPGRMRALRLLFFALIWLTRRRPRYSSASACGSPAGSAGGCTPSRSRSATTRS